MINLIKKYLLIIHEGAGIMDRLKLALLLPLNYIVDISNININLVIKNTDGIFQCNNLTEAFMYSKIREYALRKYFTLKDEETFIDIGANIGKYSVLMANKYPLNTVISIEPDARAVKVMRKNIAYNKLKNVHIIQTVVSNHTKKIKFYLNVDNSAKSTLYKEEISGQQKYNKRYKNYEMREVKRICTTLDKLLIKGKVGLIKIDTQGAELEILQGARDLLQKQRPRIIFEAWSPEYRVRISKELKKYHYIITKIDAFNYIGEPSDRRSDHA